MYNNHPKSSNLDSSTPFATYIGCRGRCGLLNLCNDFKSRCSSLTSMLIHQDPVRRRRMWRSGRRPWGKNGDIAPVDVDGDPEDQPRLDERSDPLDEPLL